MRLDADLQQRIEHAERPLRCGDVERARSGYAGIVEDGPNIGTAHYAGLLDVRWPIAGHGGKSLFEACAGDVPVDLMTVAEYANRPTDRSDHLVGEGEAAVGVKPFAGMIENALPDFIHVETDRVCLGGRLAYASSSSFRPAIATLAMILTIVQGACAFRS